MQEKTEQPGPIRRLGPLRSDSVIKLGKILFGKCTTRVVTKRLLMEPDYHAVTNENREIRSFLAMTNN